MISLVFLFSNSNEVYINITKLENVINYHIDPATMIKIIKN